MTTKSMTGGVPVSMHLLQFVIGRRQQSYQVLESLKGLETFEAGSGRLAVGNPKCIELCLEEGGFHDSQPGDPKTRCLKH